MQKVIMLGAASHTMCEGEYESLNAIHAVCSGFVPRPYSWGKYSGQASEAYFLLEEFRNIGDEVSVTVRSSIAASPMFSHA